MLTTTDAGTPLQSANSGVLIFETNLAPIGTFTLAYSLTDISGSVTTFGFTFQSPVPEPTRVVLLGTGLAAIACRRFRV